MKSWQDIGFEIEITGDESPSLRLLSSVDPSKYRGESMHHSGGACAETNLIYGEPIRTVLKETQQPRFLVVGLGLGYIELSIAREALLAGLKPEAVSLITSYESVPELREFFFLWIHNQGPLHPEVQKTYDDVLRFLLVGTDLTEVAVKNFLAEHFKTVSDLSGALHADISFSSQYECILYDAFSSKTSPFLWEEDFLNRMLAQTAAEKCLFSTYACRGSLKRSLKNLNFDVVVREGFQGKRNSTLGVRGSWNT